MADFPTWMVISWKKLQLLSRNIPHNEMMSNIFTDFIRIYARPGDSIRNVEAQWITWRLLGPRGSYNVPVHTERSPDGRFVDIQYGSGKNPASVEEEVGWGYSAIWKRFYNEGGDQDTIWHTDDTDVNEAPARYCRYGFDEVRIRTAHSAPPVAPQAPWQQHTDGSWRLATRGSYRTGNDRSAVKEAGPCATPALPPPQPGTTGLVTPTTPNFYGDELDALDPPWLAPLANGHPDVTLVEYRWRGRLVHRVREEDELWGRDWQHRCADGWDNCLDPHFLDFTGATDLRAPDEVYARDKHDWDALNSRW
ncbi:hypothetical protein [Streptomyces sp. 3N207]|uniref:hypothetical protein n=1 Tax=Streptomyces sp. 3N207 TaxID=3457417 RepID=UPI003FD3E85A